MLVLDSDGGYAIWLRLGEDDGGTWWLVGGEEVVVVAGRKKGGGESVRLRERKRV